MESDVEQESLLSSIQNISEAIDKLLREAREDARGDTEDFVSKKIGKLFRSVKVYKAEFERVNVSGKEAFERKASRLFRNKDVREAFDDLLDKENEWDSFLKDIDKHLVTSGTTVLQEGDTGPVEETVINARSGSSEQLSKYLNDQEYVVMVLLRHFA